MAIFETTCRQYELVMGGKVYRDTKSADEPMGYVRWDDVRGVTNPKWEDQRLFDRYDWPTSRIVSDDSFAGRLTGRTGLKFDLPTEAQWEYACRAGTTTLYNIDSDSPYDLFKCASFGSNGKFGWENHRPILHVGAFSPNRWGLYDMHGNRDEWCLDHASLNPPSRCDDPVGPDKHENEYGYVRVLRGGNRRDHPEDCTSTSWRSAHRYGEDLDEDWFAGFRIVFSVNPPIQTQSRHEVQKRSSSNMTCVVIPEGVTHIAAREFWSCSMLEYLRLPASLRKIKSAAFMNCTALRTLVIPHVTELEDSVFYGCAKLTHVTLPCGIRNIHDSAFRGCSSLQTITIPRSITNLGAYAFADCHALETVTLPQSVHRLKEGTFEGCTGLREIILPQGLVSIGTGSFLNCRSLKSITLPGSLHQVDRAAFAGLTSLQEIILPDENPHFKNQDNCLFERRSGTLIAAWGRRTLQIPMEVRIVAEHAFDSCPLVEHIEIPTSVTQIDPQAFNNCPALKEIVVAGGNSRYKSADGVLYSRQGDILVRCPCGFPGSSYSVRTGCRELGMSAFRNCGNFEKIILPSTLAKIGNLTFDGCDHIHEMVIPCGVTQLDKMAFGSCNSLRLLKFMGLPQKISDPLFETNMTNLLIEISGRQLCPGRRWLMK